MSNQLRSTHLSSAALFVGLLATAAFAPPVPPPPPSLADHPVGVVLLEDQEADGFVLAENGRDYERHIALKVINNVPVNVVAKVLPVENSGLPDTWSVRLNEPGEDQSFHPDSTSNEILELHGPGAAGELELCIKVKGVDMRWHAEHHALTDVPVAHIALTVVPNP